MKPYPLRVADRGRLAFAPEGAHLAPIVQKGVGADRARGLDEGRAAERNRKVS